MKIIKANRNDSGQRLDKFLGKIMPQAPKSLIYKGIRKNNVRINGKHCHDEKYIVCENDEFSLYFPDDLFRENKKTSLLPAPDVIYEDDNIIIVNKPRGLSVHADEKNSNDNLINRILNYLHKKKEYNPKTENSFTPALCNRLDRNTSGLLIAAKNASALRIINDKIKNREIKKYYFAVAEGIFKKKKDTLISYLERKEKIVKINDEGSGKQSITKYRVISEKNNTSLLEIELLTGRTHQIRSQLSAIGHPLVGDVKYKGKKSDGGYKLISYKLVFSFTSDSGPLSYLNGKEITLQQDYQDF